MLKVISWNIAHRPDLWREVLDADADIALLQEACEPPADIASRFDVGDEPWNTEGLVKRPWRAALVRLRPEVKLDRIRTVPAAQATATDLAVSRGGTLSAARVEDPDTGEIQTLVSMYAAWEWPHPSEKSSWIYADASAHRLVSDISALVGREHGHRVLAAGDLNILHGYGEGRNTYWAARYRTVFDRLAVVGLQFVGPQYPNGRQAHPWPEELPRESLNVPTFHTNRQTAETATRQLDFVFASKGLAGKVSAVAENKVEEWRASDHCRLRIEIQ